MKLFDVTKIPLLHRAMDTYALRQKVIANNLANITTSGYRSKSVEFEQQLANAIRTPGATGSLTHDRHIPLGNDPGAGVQPSITDSSLTGSSGDPEFSNGVNDVDLEHEMAELAKNQIRFKFSSRLVAETFRGIQKSIRGTT